MAETSLGGRAVGGGMVLLTLGFTLSAPRFMNSVIAGTNDCGAPGMGSCADAARMFIGPLVVATILQVLLSWRAPSASSAAVRGVGIIILAVLVGAYLSARVLNPGS